MYRRAREKKIWSLDVVNIRDFAIDKHGSVDDKPFGGVTVVLKQLLALVGFLPIPLLKMKFMNLMQNLI
jgi:tRNA (guanine-N1)-methyltransferase